MGAKKKRVAPVQLETNILSDWEVRCRFKGITSGYGPNERKDRENRNGVLCFHVVRHALCLMGRDVAEVVPNGDEECAQLDGRSFRLVLYVAYRIVHFFRHRFGAQPVRKNKARQKR